MFDRLVAYWTTHDYVVLDDRRTNTLPYVWVQSRPDGYRLSLERNIPGDILLTVSSPLFEPSTVEPGPL